MTPGTRLGPYEVVTLVGSGGMGEVYKAKDTRLDRTVAIKVLPAHVSADPERRTRFEREARTIAALNHPHICTLHDVGSVSSPQAAAEAPVLYLVMEHLTGETLAERLARGPLPFEQALEVGVQIADALAAAHRQGIVHRDLKPGNVMLTKAGAKLLDFGLAKLRAPGAPLGADFSALATQAAPETEKGTILGTLAYMAPEQLEGKEADAPSDLFSFGAVLYEMLTGRRAFAGATPASVISAVMTSEPPLVSTLQPLMPPALDRVVRQCLAKAPDERWQNAADLAGVLRFVAEGGARSTPETATLKRRHRAGVLLGATAVAVAAFVMGAVLSRLLVTSPPVQRQVIRSTLTLPADAPLVQPKDLPYGIDRASLAISPDGRRIAYVAINGGVRRLYVKQLDEDRFRPLNGTEDASDPFFKPDGEWLAFFSAGKLKKVAFGGGSLSEICDAPFTALGGSWNRHGWIVFSDADGRVSRVREEGGPAEFDQKLSDNAVCLPRIQPDGESLLATGCYIGGSRLLSLASGTVHAVFGIGGDPFLTPTGHLVAAGEGVLRAARFDTKAHQIVGDEITVLEGVRTTAAVGAQYALSDTGTLVYALGGAADEGRLVKVDRAGVAQDLGAPPGIYHHVSVAPDGNRIAVSMKDGARVSVFTIDLRRPHLLSPLASDGTANRSPIWNARSDMIAFCSDRGGVPRLWVQAADAGSEATRLLETGSNCVVSSWSADTLVLGRVGEKSNFVLKALDTSSRQSRVLLDTGADTFWGLVSPNSKWLLYGCSKSGVSQICIRCWPDVASSREVQISTQGGGDPLWNPDGTELFYRNGNQFMVVPMPASGVSLDAWIPRPELMFRGDYLNVHWRPWDGMPDGRHFIMIQPAHASPPQTELHLIVNWFEELKTRVPDKR